MNAHKSNEYGSTCLCQGHHHKNFINQATPINDNLLLTETELYLHDMLTV